MDEPVLVAIVFLIMGIFTGFMLGAPYGSAIMERQAIQHLHAHYDIQSGAFTWNEVEK